MGILLCDFPLANATLEGVSIRVGCINIMSVVFGLEYVRHIRYWAKGRYSVEHRSSKLDTPQQERRTKGQIERTEWLVETKTRRAETALMQLCMTEVRG